MNIFDKRGQLDLTGLDEEIAALDPARRKSLDVLIAAAKHSEQAEAALKNGEADIKQMMTDQQNAVREVERTARKYSHHDLYLQTVKKIPATPPTPEQIAAEAAVDATTEQLAIARDALDSARVAVKDSRAAFATSLSVWQNNGQPIPTREDLVRSAAKSFKPTPAPQRQYITEIDRIAAAQAGSQPQKHAQAHGPGFRRQAYGAQMRGRLAPGFVKS